MARNKYFTNVKPRLRDIEAMCLEMNENQIANALGVSKASFERYKAEHEELREALRKGKRDLVRELKSALIKKAEGFSYKERKKTIRHIGGEAVTTIEEYEKYSPPDTGAIHLLLKNLDETWRNDDRETMDLKRQRLEMEKEKNEANNW